MLTPLDERRTIRCPATSLGVATIIAYVSSVDSHGPVLRLSPQPLVIAHRDNLLVVVIIRRKAGVQQPY